MEMFARLEPGGPWGPAGFGTGSIGIGLFVINGILKRLFNISMKIQSRQDLLPKQKNGYGVVRGFQVRSGICAKLEPGVPGYVPSWSLAFRE